MSSPSAPRIAVGPTTGPAWVLNAIESGGGQLVEVGDADSLVWLGQRPSELADVLDDHPQIQWVQLAWAGVERFMELTDDDRTWTCGKGVYSDPVAELALSLGLAGLRHVGAYSRATRWGDEHGRSLFGGRVTVLGGGGITESLLALLAPFRAHVTVVRNRVQAMEGADEVVGPEHLHDCLPGADLVVLALALTPDTEGIISGAELSLMEPHAWLVNVARGRHVVTDDLVEALAAGTIGGAGLDVTDPEPLPSDHRLWTMPNCIITPHVGNTDDMVPPLLGERIATNVRRWADGEPLLGLVSADLGY